MSDWAAMTAAGIVSDTLWIQECGRALRERQDLQELSVDNALLRRDAAEIAARYNQLVADFNNLRHRAIEEMDRRGAALAALEAECARLRQENKEKDIHIAFLHATLDDIRDNRFRNSPS